MVVLVSTAQAQTNITVNASSVVTTISSDVYGNNMACWEGLARTLPT